ncbi:HNH endonuclease signature motif containing protein [Corynebacterium liangguodongii]|uniref:HNH endonuclease signature motif containing protein n=1 Tax=Corynebacterium liangguodongii TaxID=2079535 RepID=UPI001304D1A0|nr:HNH endonuclease signature motif containing protein [Corynebacterium liangguodongii]
MIHAIRRHQEWSTRSKAELLIAIAEFDARGLFENFGETCTAGWLAREIHIAPSTAFEYVGVARQLEQFPMLTAAFRRGEVCYSTVRYLLKRLTVENERQLVDLARRLCFPELKRALAGLEPSDGAETREYHHSVRVEDNGDVVITARLNAADGAAYLAALKVAQLADYGFDDVTEEDLADGERIDDLLEEKRKLPEACPSQEQELEPEPDQKRKPLSRFGPPTREDMYGALLSMINVVRTRPVSDLRTPGAHVNIMMTTNGRAWLPGNVAAPSSVLQNYVGDAFVRLHLIDDNGVTVHVGKSTRFVNDGQLRALLAVWGYECAMPGCNHARFIEVHHIKEWCEGGKTELENLIPLCSACHSKVTNGLAHISTNGRDIEFRFLGGRRFISRARGLPERDVDFTGPLVPPGVSERADSFDD